MWAFLSSRTTSLCGAWAPCWPCCSGVVGVFSGKGFSFLTGCDWGDGTWTVSAVAGAGGCGAGAGGAGVSTDRASPSVASEAAVAGGGGVSTAGEAPFVASGTAAAGA